MKKTDEHQHRAPKPWWQRIGWFIAIWCLSVAALGAVAWLLKQVAV